MSSKKVAIIQGGASSEKEISRITGENFKKALESLGYLFEVYEADQNLYEKLRTKKPDVALIALHGKFGEDGTIQGVCELLKIPYTGSGVFASALCMEKSFLKKVLSFEGILTPSWRSLNVKTREDLKTLRFEGPCVVKPSREGSSFGVSIVKEEKDFSPALKEALKYDNYILVEKYIPGKEVAIPLWKGKALSSIEIKPHEGFYDYTNKYTKGKTDYIIPAQVSDKALQTMNEVSEKVFDILSIRQYARLDFMLDEKEQPYLIEVNTLPGFTPLSLLPQSAKKEGMEFKDLVKELVEGATLDYVEII